MGIIANYTAYPADYIDAVIRDGDGENDTELAEYGLEKDSLLLHRALTGADDEDDAFDASIFATPAARVAEIAAALDRADINALITQHAAALQGYDRQDNAAGLRARCQACFAELRAFYRQAADLSGGVLVSRM